MAVFTTERITDVRHWSDQLFSFRTTRSASLRFETGQFLMIGLEVDGRRISRAYSIASANHEDELEFYSIKVPNGPLTSRLQHVRNGDPILISTKPTGTLVLRDLRAGRRLILLATGTGIAPFAGVLADPETYERFESVIVVRGGRGRADLAYGDFVLGRLLDHPYFGDLVRAQVVDYPSVTREPFPTVGRVTTLLAEGRVCGDLGVAPLDPAHDRVMICGNMRMLADAQRLLDERGFVGSPSVGEPGDYVIERAFVDAVEPRPVKQSIGA